MYVACMDLSSPTDPRAIVAGRIRDLRTERRLTQEELAQRADVVVRTVQNLEAGRITPRHKTRRAIAKALGVPVEQLEVAS